MLDPVQGLGRATLKTLAILGRFGVFFAQALCMLAVPPFKLRQTYQRVSFIGVRSMSIILLTGAFTGMVLGLQGILMLRRVGSEAFVGPLVALSLVRELGPVLSALTVTGRAGSALAAEIGVMRITEQIDALTVMALNPMRYLVVPTLVAGVIALPILGWVFDVLGIFGGYLVAVKLFGVSGGTYFGQIQTYLSTTDLWVGFWKSLVFGIIITWVACYKGFYVGHGAEGVGRATTEAVVLASVLIFVFDYFMGSVLP
ncbi:MAG: ABC transporter permease [Candidatus Rokubacteria bacterium]|nr:ABC transporter permease [Candidatus Rokubacteria bacterium]